MPLFGINVLILAGSSNCSSSLSLILFITFKYFDGDCCSFLIDDFLFNDFLDFDFVNFDSIFIGEKVMSPSLPMLPEWASEEPRPDRSRGERSFLPGMNYLGKLCGDEIF